MPPQAKSCDDNQDIAIEHAQCVGPQGMAIGPNPRILLGCSGVGTAPYAEPLSTSVVISAIDGSTIFSLGTVINGLGTVNGVDEVWYNPDDNSYYLAAPNDTIGNPFTGAVMLEPIIAVLDAGGATEPLGQDQVVALGPAGSVAHLIAAGGNVVYLPSSVCGCVNIYLANTDDPGVIAKK